MWVVAGARALQGLGGGLLFSVPLAAIMQFLPAHLHRHALALNAATWSASALLGPPLGSLLTEVASWRLVFLVGLPPLALSVFLARRGLRGHVPAPTAHVRLNVVGPALLALVVLLLLVVPLAAVVPAALFLWQERRAAQPVFPRTTNGRVVCLLAAAGGVAFVGSEAFVQLDLQAGVGWSVIAAAVPLILATCAWTVGSMTMARVQLAPRTMMGIGTAVAAVGCGIMALPVEGGLAVGLGLTVAALGMGIQSPGLFIAVVFGAEGEEGRVTSSVPVARTIGGGIGIAHGGRDRRDGGRASRRWTPRRRGRNRSPPSTTAPRSPTWRRAWCARWCCRPSRCCGADAGAARAVERKPNGSDRSRLVRKGIASSGSGLDVRRRPRAARPDTPTRRRPDFVRWRATRRAAAARPPCPAACGGSGSRSAGCARA